MNLIKLTLKITRRLIIEGILFNFLKLNPWKVKRSGGGRSPSTPGLLATLCNILFCSTIIIFAHYFISFIQFVDVVIYYITHS